MKRTTIMIAVGLALAVALPTAPAQAGAARTFVSPTGNDGNNCSLLAPCRFLQAAFAQTNAGGEIAVLGTAGYNNGATFTINKAISIVNPDGFEAGIAVPSGGPGIFISAGASDAVNLRGLTIEGGGVGEAGIVFNGGASLTIENSIVRHVTQWGILFGPNTASTLAVSNTLVADNAGDGILVEPSGSGDVTVVINRVELLNNGGAGFALFGTDATGVITATVSDSVAARNYAGFWATSAPNYAGTAMMVVRSVVSRNDFGLIVDDASICIANSTLTWNHTGWGAYDGGWVGSYGDNYIYQNGASTASLSLFSKQ